MGRGGLITTPRFLSSSEETFALGEELAQSLKAPSVLALKGDLGAGKTTFVKGLAKGLQIQEPIQSPTFTFLHLYPSLAHFDLYRLTQEEDFIQLGFEEYFFSTFVCAIEWPEKITNLLPKETLHIHFEYEKKGRKVFIS